MLMVLEIKFFHKDEPMCPPAEDSGYRLDPKLDYEEDDQRRGRESLEKNVNRSSRK